MAIDSEDKRRVVAGIHRVPDGGIDSEGERREVAGIYSMAEEEEEPAVRNPAKIMLLGVG